MTVTGAATELAKAQAESRFQRQREQEATAQAGNAAEKARLVAEREKTVRLRALRLAKEEADRVAAANAPPPVKKTRTARAKPKA